MRCNKTFLVMGIFLMLSTVSCDFNKDGAENNSYDIQVGPNANINVQVDKGSINLVTKDGKINVNSAGDYNVKVGGNYTMTVAGNRSITTEGSTTDNTTGAVTHRGKTIDLNPTS